MARSHPFLLIGMMLLVSGAPAFGQQAALDKAIASADAEAGKRFALRCKACHTLDKGGANRLGPNLWNIVGRKKSSVEKYNYSPAFRQLTGVWSLEQLDGFMTDPRKFVPRTKMVFPGIKNVKQRHNLLAYLATLNDAPPRAKAASGEVANSTSAASLADELDLPQGTGREDVAAICAACHSLSIVRQQGLDADRWDELMTWMTEKQGMPELEAEQRKNVVSYLAEHFGPQSRQARPNAMNPMMPPMPSMPSPMPSPMPK